MAKRRWSLWPGRFSRELNAISGVAGLGGIAVGASGVNFSPVLPPRSLLAQVASSSLAHWDT